MLDLAAPAPALDAPARGVLRTLLYYDQFGFPLRPDELVRLCRTRIGSLAEAQAVVDALAARGFVRSSAGYVQLSQRDAVGVRQAAERRADQMLPRALARSRLIARFPFVRGVCLSGTISKGVMGPGDDVDFFVITAPSRVWLCRALLMTFKRVALLGSHRLFCVNYLMSEDQLAVPDRNLFTATEIAWLRPTVGQLPYRRFVAANAWVSEFFPNWSPAARSVAEVVTGPLARACERALRGARGDALDARCRAAIERRNRKRHGHLPPEIYEVALRATKAASKHHPSHYQDRVIGRLEAAIADFERCHGVSLSLAEPMTRASRPGLELAVAGGRA